MVMSQRFHRGFTAAEKTELWDRWKRGESLKAIGRAFGKPSSSIYFLVAPHGGIRPALRHRSRLALTLPEREVISRGIAAHQSARSIAKLLGRSPSTVSREMSRNGGYDRYRAALADGNAWTRARRPKCCKLANSPRLRQAVAGKLRLDWSPEQIAGWLKRTHPEDECNHPSLWWFFNKVKRLWLASLKRRSQTARLSWERFIPLVARFFPPIRTIHPLPCHRFDARTRGRSPVR
jgi:DNA-binding CsgD family transcriptional regulator